MKKTVFLVAALLAATHTHAARPFFTDDAAIVDAGGCQLELFHERFRDQRLLSAVPACNPFGQTELAFGVSHSYVPDDSNAHLSFWQVKHQLRDISPHASGVAVSVSDTRDRRIHSGVLGDTDVRVLVSTPLEGNTLLLHTNAGILRERRVEASSSQVRSRLQYGFLLDAEVLPQTRAGLELTGVGSDRPLTQLGFAHELVPSRLQIDASVGSGLGRFNSSRFTSVGLVYFTDATPR